MPKWLRKSFVVLVTILTFGLVTPSQAFLIDNQNSGKSQKRDTFESGPSEVSYFDEVSSEHFDDRNTVLNQLLSQAEDQSYIKFGSKIKPVIEDEFKNIILPNIESAIEKVASDFSDETINYLSVTEIPSGGHSERIFNIIDNRKDQDVIRFHVRKDHPPQEGYWFNFHYHTYHDQFQTHHDLGSIYWDKNMPPKWMS